MHSQHHLVQAQALGLISEIKQISVMTVTARANSDMPISSVHSYYSHGISIRMRSELLSRGKGNTQKYTMHRSLCRVTWFTGPVLILLLRPVNIQKHIPIELSECFNVITFDSATHYSVLVFLIRFM